MKWAEERERNGLNGKKRTGRRVRSNEMGKISSVCVRRSERTYWTLFFLGRVEDEYETLSHSFQILEGWVREGRTIFGWRKKVYRSCKDPWNTSVEGEKGRQAKRIGWTKRATKRIKRASGERREKEKQKRTTTIIIGAKWFHDHPRTLVLLGINWWETHRDYKCTRHLDVWSLTTSLTRLFVS